VHSAPLGRRVAAIALDWLASIGVVLLVLGTGSYLTSTGSLAILAVFFAEIVIFTWLITGSFGQKVLGLSVTRTDGSRLAFWRIAVRTALICLVLPPVVMNDEGRGLHDLAVDSIVTKVR
jgi:uncharacterized RDD family membrane protein YckC